MRCPNKKIVGVLIIVVVILTATVLSVVNGINIFGSTETSKNNDKNSFENSPHSTSTNLHMVLTGSVVGNNNISSHNDCVKNNGFQG